MVTTASQPEEPQTSMEEFMAGVDRGVRVAVTGSSVAPVRRILLSAIIAGALIFAPLPAAIVGVVAVLLLMQTEGAR